MVKIKINVTIITVVWLEEKALSSRRLFLPIAKAAAAADIIDSKQRRLFQPSLRGKICHNMCSIIIFMVYINGNRHKSK
jgi:hypothetical protein